MILIFLTVILRVRDVTSVSSALRNGRPPSVTCRAGHISSRPSQSLCVMQVLNRMNRTTAAPSATRTDDIPHSETSDDMPFREQSLEASMLLICEQPQRATQHLLVGSPSVPVHAVSSLHPKLRDIASIESGTPHEPASDIVSKIDHASAIAVQCSRPLHLNLVQSLRQMCDRDVPVVALCDPNTARGVSLLAAGADYLYKPPVSVQTLEATKMAFERHQQRSESTKATARGNRRPIQQRETLSVGPVTFNADSYTVTICDERKKMSRRPYELFRYLAEQGGACCSRMQIIEEVWDLEFDPGTNIVDVQIYKLRKLLKKHDLRSMIQTVRGRGYRLNITKVSY